MRSFFYLWAIITFYLLLSPSSVQARRKSPWLIQLRLHLFMEFDDNVRRLSSLSPKEQDPTAVFQWKRLVGGEIRSPLPPVAIEQDGLHKVGAQAKLRYRKRNHILKLSYNLGFKNFYFTKDENTLINRVTSSYFYRIKRRLLIGLNLQLTDRQRENQAREYTSPQGQLQVLWFAPKKWNFLLQAGYQSFFYRHLEDAPEAHIDGFSDGQRFSFHGDQYSLLARRKWTRHFRTRFSYDFARLFHQFRYKQDPNQPSNIYGASEPRTDFLHGLSAGFRFLYIILIDLSYRLEVSQSESVAESFLGHRIKLMLATRLPWKLYLLLQAQLMFRTYFDGFVLNDISQRGDNDENLTAVTIRLSKPIIKSIRLSLRYSYYANQFSIGATSYSRNILSFGVSFRY